MSVTERPTLGAWLIKDLELRVFGRESPEDEGPGGLILGIGAEFARELGDDEGLVSYGVLYSARC